jgi:starch phosphorylase
VVRGVPYDYPVLGHGTNNANFLRLWSAVAAEDFDLDAFQEGQYVRSVEAKVRSENITKVLYPKDETPAGKQLRLEQEYFFVSCALQDCLRFLHQRTTIDHFAEKFAIQLNDTHPTLAIPELMRLLIDVHGMGWDAAWSMVTRTFSYTNHTLLPEALETWGLPLFARLLPRHLEIIYEINHRFLEEVRAKYPGDEARAQRMSLIDERGDRAVRMANLATVASQKINGVAELHSKLLRETVLKDFAEFFPERFLNVTNGITPRRFLTLANPALARLLNEAIGDGWRKDLEQLRELLPLAEDAAFREKFRAVKRANKEQLASWLASAHGITVDPKSLFDAQCKRIHEYKRQHLNLLHAIWLYSKIKRGERPLKRTILFAGKAAPGYRTAKLMIRLINGVAQAVEREVGDHLRVVFVPDFNVKNAQRIYPAADLSEQISTAGMEASGTGNMKFALNGALTIGTLDGANIEIRDAVGPENFFLFGMTAAEVSARRPHYRPEQVLADDPELTEVVATLAETKFSDGERGLFEPIIRSLVEHDPFFVLADFRAYIDCQERVAKLWSDPDAWTRAAIRNVATMGRFSSDRSIAEYAREIWKVEPVVVPGLRLRPDL